MSITDNLDGYSFRLHMAMAFTDLTLNTVCWNEKQKRVWYVELTVYMLIGERKGT